MAEKAAGKKTSDEPNFEEAMAQLEGIVHLLEEGDIGLNEALARYEQGVRLLRLSYDLLEHAENRIELLSGADTQGNPICRPFDDQAARPKTQSPPRRIKRTSTTVGGPSDGQGSPQVGDNDMDASGEVS